MKKHFNKEKKSKSYAISEATNMKREEDYFSACWLGICFFSGR